MKIHNDFTLYFRVAPSGKRVVYFYAYDENGKRTQGRSTGQTTKTAARVLVNRLLKEGALLPKKDNVPTFGEYAAGWWDWEKKVLRWNGKINRLHIKLSGSYCFELVYYDCAGVCCVASLRLNYLQSGDNEFTGIFYNGYSVSQFRQSI